MTTDTGAKKRILVVEDDPDLVLFLETLLQDNGYATLSATNGKEGFEKFEAERPDLVTLDISMPEQSGIRFYRNVKENPDYAATPVVVVTGITSHTGDPEDFRRFLSTRKQVPPPDAFFPKPVDKAAFLAKLAELLA